MHEKRLTYPTHKRGLKAVNVIGSIFLFIGLVCLLYVVWQLWWTGIQSAKTQEEKAQQTHWVTPAHSNGSYRIAKPQPGMPPVDPEPADGATIGQVYIPRFGLEWHRLVVQGVSLTQLNRHGMGHYPQTATPGAIGNFALAGHRAGYGEPLGDVQNLRPGDAVVMRTTKYWYIYTLTSHEIVLPTDTQVIDPVPNRPGAKATQRLITLTTCHPQYTTPTHRWIVHGHFKYWARVSDGIPAELASRSHTGAIDFDGAKEPVAAKMPDLTVLIAATLALLAILFIAACIAWGLPGEHHAHAVRQGWPKAIKIAIWVVVAVLFAEICFEWIFPWLTATVPALRQASAWVG